MSTLTATRIPQSAAGFTPPRITQELAARSAALCYTDLPEDVRLRVRQCLLDWIGVTLAGACEPLVHMLAVSKAATPRPRSLGMAWRPRPGRRR